MDNQNFNNSNIETNNQVQTDRTNKIKEFLLKLSNFNIMVFIISLFGLMASIILWAFDLSNYSALIAFLTCTFTCLGFLPVQ